METFIAVLAVVFGIVGIVGSVLPALPGPPVSWVGMLLLYFWGGTNGAGEGMSLTLLLVWLAVTVVITVLDYIVPMYFTKWTGGSKYASIGTMVGLIAGIIFTPIGMILGAFLGAFLGELLFARKEAGESLVAALGAFLGFIVGTGMKLIVCAVMFYYIIVYI